MLQEGEGQEEVEEGEEVEEEPGVEMSSLVFLLQVHQEAVSPPGCHLTSDAVPSCMGWSFVVPNLRSTEVAMSHHCLSHATPASNEPSLAYTGPDVSF